MAATGPIARAVGTKCAIRWGRSARAGGAAALVALAGCAEDRILPVDAVCGNLIREGDEECDLADAGCAECRVAPGFACDDAGCTPVCGDGRLVADEECDPPDGLACDSSCTRGERAATCDLAGYWILRQTSFSRDDVLSQIQTASNWYVLEITQTGDSFTVERSIFCGIHVSGSATVDLTEGGQRGLLWLNSMGRENVRGGLAGAAAETAGGCSLETSRLYFVRGGAETLLPDDFSRKPALADLAPLPYEEDPEQPTGAHLDGALDVDGDGLPGVAFLLSGNANGLRNVVQRDWLEYTTPLDGPIAAHSIEFSARAVFDNEENVLVVSKCPALGCGILTAGSVPVANAKNRVVFRYLGRDLAEPRVTRIVEGALREDQDRDLATCANVRAALPHDGAKE